MTKRTGIWLAGASAILMILSATASAAEHKYVGVRDCSRCHKKELIGDQARVWKKSAHAKAFKTLEGPEALEIAKKRGMTEAPSKSGDCLRCHATAYGVPADMVERGSLRLQDGVQCESCHGPGADYKSNEVMSDEAKAIAAGLKLPDKDETICTGCHNSDSPTFKSFDYAEYKKKIAHPIPKDVKGHYLELEESQGGKEKEQRRY